MTRKTCGNCAHFGKEPNTPSRGCCFMSAEFDYYVVRGAHWAGCRDWEEREEVSEAEEKAALWDGIARCGECGSGEPWKHDGFTECERFNVVNPSNGFCSWGWVKEES